MDHKSVINYAEIDTDSAGSDSDEYLSIANMFSEEKEFPQCDTCTKQIEIRANNFSSMQEPAHDENKNRNVKYQILSNCKFSSSAANKVNSAILELSQINIDNVTNVKQLYSIEDNMDSPINSDSEFSKFVFDLEHSLSQCNSNVKHAPQAKHSKSFEKNMKKMVQKYDVNKEEAMIKVMKEEDRKEAAGSSHQEELEEEREASLDTSFESTETDISLTSTGALFQVSGLDLIHSDEEEEEEDDCESSDEQQNSQSLSLSQSISVSVSVSISQHQEGIASESTDKGLSKRYDSPCSDDEDADSVYTSKLEDWAENFTDFQNNNGSEFQEYYDEYLREKPSTSTAHFEDDRTTDGIEDCLQDQITPVEEFKSSVYIQQNPRLSNNNTDLDITPSEETQPQTEKASFLEYRHSEAIEDIVEDTPRLSCAPIKRKHNHVDDDGPDDIECELVTEKFQMTCFVPDHGSCAPIGKIPFRNPLKHKLPPKRTCSTEFADYYDDGDSSDPDIDSPKKQISTSIFNINSATGFYIPAKCQKIDPNDLDVKLNLNLNRNDVNSNIIKSSTSSNLKKPNLKLGLLNAHN